MAAQPASDRPKRYEVIRQGLEDLRSPEKASVDIVAVPGLGANPEKTWSHPEKKFNWLKDDEGLAKDFPSARILLYHYASAWLGDLKVTNFLDNIAEGLLNALHSKRQECSRRPIVFIGHSMGGLVVAKTVCCASSLYNLWPMTFEATSGCIFFGTPFDGAPAASIAAMYASIAKSTGQAETSALLEIMKFESEYLRELKKEFLRLAVKLSEKIQICCFWECMKTDIPKMAGMDWGLVSAAFNVVVRKNYQYLVSKDSSILVGHEECGLHSAHRNLVQFKGFRDEKYQMIRTPLKRIIHGASLVAKGRFCSTRNIDREMVRKILNALEVQGVHMQRKRKILQTKLVSQSWILDEPEYSNWFHDIGGEGTHDEKCLWIRGPEGKGKTSATMAVIDHIDKISAEADAKNSSSVLSAFFFCDKSKDCSSADEVLKSIIRQLVHQQETLASHAKQFIKKKDKGQDKGQEANSKSQSNTQAHLSVENLWQSLQGMFTDNLVGAIYIIVNGAHELPEKDNSTRTFLNLLRDQMANMRNYEGQVHVRWLFTSRERHNLGKALDHEDVHLINLNDDKYNSKVQSEVQRHAQKKIEELRADKQYNLALSYFANSLVGRRAETTKWVNVTCVNLEALPSTADDLQVRRQLEETPQDVKVLIDRVWLQVLHEKGEDTAKIKEMLRALVLTYEDPTEEELAILAGLSSSPEGMDELKHLVKRCSPWLKHTVLDYGEERISFANEEVMEHLKTYSEDLLGLSEEEKRWQHGMIALRCFDHIQVRLEGAEPSQSEEEESTNSEDNANSEDSEWQDSEKESTSEDDRDEDKENEEEGGENSLAEEEPIPTESKALEYPILYWLEHASKATSDIARILSEQEEFWLPDSKKRLIWLQELRKLDDDLDDVEIDGWKSLHVAAAFGYAHLVSSLIENGHQSEIFDRNSENYTPLHLAALFGREDIVEELLDKGANINDGGGGDGTPLAFAAWQGHISVMESILQRDEVDPCASGCAWPVLNSAIGSGKVEAVKLLLDRGAPLVLEAETDEDGDEITCPLAHAVRFADATIFNQLCEAGQNIITSKEYDQAFMAAAETGRLDALSKLVEFPHSQESYQDALKQAMIESSWGAVPILLKNSEGLQCEELLLAAAVGTEQLPEVAEAIWDHTQAKIPPDVVNECLYKATDNEKASTVKVLLEKFNADPNATGEDLARRVVLRRAGNSVTQ